MIGDRIRQARLAVGLTQDEVVRRLASAGLKITKAAVSKYEKGKSTPKQSVLVFAGEGAWHQAGLLSDRTGGSHRVACVQQANELRKGQQEQIKAFVERAVESQSRLEMSFTQAALTFPRAAVRLPRPRMPR